MSAYEGDVDCASSSESWRSKMHTFMKDVCVLLVVMCITSYAAYQTQPPKVSKVLSPVRFFRQNSVVDDFYTGNLNAAVEKFTSSEMSFVMFYAPWDAESQKVRWHFEAAARFYHKQIYFAAVNCWQPGSECRKQYAKIPVFPVLMLYPLHHTGVQYRGVREMAHMIRFLRTAVHPIKRIDSVEELMTLMARHEAVAVGFLDFHEDEGMTSKLYNVFYEASVQFLERDQLQEITFAVVASRETAAHFEVYDVPSIHLYMWNESVVFNGHISNWTSEIICQWVVQNLHQVAIWVQPPGIKSLTLSSYLQDGPVLVLFTPRNPLLSQIFYYDLLREVASEFYNCNNSPWIGQVNKLLSSVRYDVPHQYLEEIKACASWRKLHGQLPVISQAASIQREGHVHASVCQNFSLHNDHQSEEILFSLKESIGHGFCNFNYQTDDTKLSSDDSEKANGWFEYLSFRKKAMPSKRVDVRSLKRIRDEMYNGLTSMLVGASDHLWAENLEILEKDTTCRILRHARLLDRPFYPESEEVLSKNTYLNLTGLACSANKTLSFLALDSLQLHQFAEGLGVDVLHRRDKTAVFILNPEQESHHLLQGDLTKEALVTFIKGYVNNTLPRWLRTTSLKPRDIGFSFGPTQTIHLSRYSERVLGSCSNNTVCVPELSSSTFKSKVLDSKKNVVLMYYSPYCAFCSGVSHVFLTVAHTLSSVSTTSFARIDGDNNDLPWEFTMHQLPSILFFPAQKKSESHIFPAHMQITTHNLVQFILSNLSPEERVWALLVICKQGSTNLPLSFQNQLNAEKCLTQVKIEVLQAAGQLLNKYRSLIIKWSEGPGPGQQTRRSLQRSLTARLRFFRHASSTLMAVSGSNATLSISDALKQVREAFFQQKEMLDSIYIKDTSSIDDQIRLNVDLHDVSKKLSNLSSSINGVLNSSNISYDSERIHDEL